MKRLQLVLGFLGGALLLLSAAAHSVLGWKGISAELAKARVPSDLIQGLEMGWHFGGALTLAVGCIVILLFVSVAKGQPVSLRPVIVIALVYLGFGGWALVFSHMDPFCLIFIIPGLILLAASWQPSSP